MKTKIKIYGTVALFFLFGFISNPSIANDRNGDTPNAELKYIGVVNDQPVFQLNLSSTKEEYYTISIKNLAGETLYTEKVKTKDFTRNFRLDTETLDDSVLKVEVKNGNNKLQVFTINRNTRYYEETSISKL